MTQTWKVADEAEADKVDQLQQAGAIGNVKNAVIGDPEKGMDKVEDYTTFLAEYAFHEGDIILHFFLTKEVHESPPSDKDRYWMRVFPQTLSNTAERYFEATQPRIFAEYVPEMTSWYMRCRGFANRLDPKEYLLQFLGQLDEQLEQAIATAWKT